MYFSKIIIKFLIILLRVSAFYVLLWIRIPLVLICEGVTSLSAVAFLVMLIVRGWLNAIEVFWPLLAFSFGAFVLRWIYDGILMLLSPEEIALDF
jgi:hypothetical protein